MSWAPNRTCQHCKSYAADDETCRRHAPRFFGTLPSVSTLGHVNALSGWPPVAKDEWCAEFSERLGEKLKRP